MKLYQHPASPNCRKPLAVAAHLGLELELELVDLTSGAQRQPAFLAINPNGKVPALVDGGTTLFESNAIMGYLCSKQDTELWPKSNARYDILKWMFWELAHWGPATGVFTFENVIKGALGLGDPDTAALEAGKPALDRVAAVLDGQLESTPFLCGEGPTLADFAVAAHLTFRNRAKLPLDSHPHINAWAERLDSIPAWRDSTPKL